MCQRHHVSLLSVLAKTVNSHSEEQKYKETNSPGGRQHLDVYRILLSTVTLVPQQQAPSCLFRLHFPRPENPAQMPKNKSASALVLGTGSRPPCPSQLLKPSFAYRRVTGQAQDPGDKAKDKPRSKARLSGGWCWAGWGLGGLPLRSQLSSTTALPMASENDSKILNDSKPGKQAIHSPPPQVTFSNCFSYVLYHTGNDWTSR